MTLAGKNVVVTGAGGSIGSELCKQLVTIGVNRLTMVSLTEGALYNLNKNLGPLADEYGCVLNPVLGSVLDRELMMGALWGSDVVVHAAAHKHVPICEDNPCEAIVNNVGGTQTLAVCAAQACVGAFVLISTDKAVRPTSVMGATKRVAERIVTGFGKATTRFLVVRFGNVMDSAGSVLPLWREQIAKGGPVTVTHRDCTRYFMAIPDACGLILGALALKESGTFVLDMGEPRSIWEMAQRLVAHELVTTDQVIPIIETGLRPGEKLTEELHHGGDLLPTTNPKIFRVDDAGIPLDCGDIPSLLALAERREKKRAKRLLMELAGGEVFASRYAA